jgi:hypothetical protein
VTAGEPEPYEVSLTGTARRHLSESLPLDVAIGASEFITGPLDDNPHRVGKELDAPSPGPAGGGPTTAPARARTRAYRR